MTQLGRYEILQQLARGSIADVLLARATGLEGFARHIVIKRIRPELAVDARFVKAFLDEARIGASLHHQNIVQVFDIDEAAGAVFFAMEYIHGEDARRLLRKVREAGAQIPVDQVVAIGAAVAAGLHHAHEQLGPDRQPLGLVHRDVSPANILIGYDGGVKLVDFALAKAALRSAKTRTGSLSGKAPYMSPELCTGKPIDRRSDIFALGIVLYELATARRLFKGPNEFLTMAAIVEGEIKPPSHVRPELPRRLDEIVMRALAKSPDERFQTAHELRAALESFAVDMELRTSAKALADYMEGLFGARVEPWHTDAEPPDLDAPEGDDDGPGLVAAPAAGATIARALPADEVSPLAIARNVAESRPDPGVDAADEEPTRMRPLDMPAFGDDNPTRLDMSPEREETATVRSGLPSSAAASVHEVATVKRGIDELATIKRDVPDPHEVATVRRGLDPRAHDELAAKRDAREPRFLEASTAVDKLNAKRRPSDDDDLDTVDSDRPPARRADDDLEIATTVPLAHDRDSSSVPTTRAPVVDDELTTKRDDDLAIPVAHRRVDSDAVDVADDATTVEPPLFPPADPVIAAARPEAVFKRRVPAWQDVRYLAAGGGIVLLLVIGLLARACSSDHPTTHDTPAVPRESR